MGVSQDVVGRLAPASSAPATPHEAPARNLPDLGTVVDRDRRAGAERTIEVARWITLIFAAVDINFPGHVTFDAASVNIVLGSWALFNLFITVALLGNHIPTRRAQYATLALDIGVATALVYLTGGFNSNLGIVFYMVIIASSLRLGLAGSLVCAAIISVLYMGVSFGVSPHLDSATINLFAERTFLFFVVALVSGLLSREMVTARARQLSHTYELEAVAFHELREVDRIKSEFMMLASHELRTPLTKIKAWITLMQEGGDRLPPAARDEGIRELRSESEHLARLTDNLLCIAQLESGEIRLKTSAVELPAVFHETISRFTESADRERFMVSIEPRAERVMADAERLALVVACLIDNALKFSPDNEPVRITTTRHANKVRIEVHDNGRRIPDGEVERVFASFYQVESPLLRQRGGFGVGLYLSRQLIERMGGKIWIDNTKARGNTFIVALPAQV